MWTSGFPVWVESLSKYETVHQEEDPEAKPKRSFKSRRSRWATFQSLGRPAILAAVVVSDLQMITSIATCIGEKPEVEKNWKRPGVGQKHSNNLKPICIILAKLGKHSPSQPTNERLFGALVGLKCLPGDIARAPCNLGICIHEGTGRIANCCQICPWTNHSLAVQSSKSDIYLFIYVYTFNFLPLTPAAILLNAWSFQFSVIHMLCILLFPAEL